MKRRLDRDKPNLIYVSSCLSKPTLQVDSWVHASDQWSAEGVKYALPTRLRGTACHLFFYRIFLNLDLSSLYGGQSCYNVQISNPTSTSLNRCHVRASSSQFVEGAVPRWTPPLVVQPEPSPKKRVVSSASSRSVGGNAPAGPLSGSSISVSRRFGGKKGGHKIKTTILDLARFRHHRGYVMLRRYWRHACRFVLR